MSVSDEEYEQIKKYCEEKRYECDCSCHRNPKSIMHMVACCTPCRYCGIRVPGGSISMKRHMKRLHPEKLEGA